MLIVLRFLTKKYDSTKKGGEATIVSKYLQLYIVKFKFNYIIKLYKI